MYDIQYRYRDGSRNWRDFTSTSELERAERLCDAMVRNASRPVDGRIAIWRGRDPVTKRSLGYRVVIEHAS
jgi:hypothetical protein